VTTELSVRFAGGPYAAASARHALGSLRDVIGPSRLDDLCLLVSELVTNGVRHAGAAESDEFELEVRRRADCLHVEVSDPGPGFSRGAMRYGGDENGGWGLFLVDRLADSWGVRRRAGANRVWFELALGSGSASAGAVDAAILAVMA
jgi:anti-sigma regulatory factor (Ser/Thr protein kinase)